MAGIQSAGAGTKPTNLRVFASKVLVGLVVATPTAVSHSRARRFLTTGVALSAEQRPQRTGLSKDL